MLWAVHISNGVLGWQWLVAGIVGAIALLVVSAWRLQAEEVPRIALLTAAFYVGSSMHIPVGFTSVHLVLNGLVGVVLGWRSALAIFVGLVLQAVLLTHGGYLELGINTCVITPPALFAGVAFRALNRFRWLKHPIARAALVVLAVAFWTIGTVAAVTLVWRWASGSQEGPIDAQLLAVLTSPITLGAALVLGALAAWLERRLEHAPEFPLGALVGVLCVLLTVALNCSVLMAGGAYFADTVGPRMLAIAYLPVAAIEGVIMGFTTGFLAKVKPELLGLAVSPPVVCVHGDASCATYEGGKTSSNATSH
jgi:cobalt/nickel transport system permease protein